MTKKYKKVEKSFRQILWNAGFTDQSMKGVKDISDYLLVSERTIRRWILNNRPSSQALEKLENRDRNLNSHWDKFKIERDSITTPSGYRYSTNDLEGLAIEIERMKAFYNK